MAKKPNKSTSSSPVPLTKDLYRMCRTCLKPRTTDSRPDMKFFSIFDTHQESRELIGSLLIDCTDIDLLMDQSRPISTFICKDCYEKLLRWYHFRETAKASNTFIMNSMSKITKQPKSSKKRKVDNKPAPVEPQLVEHEKSPEVLIPTKSEPVVKIKIITPTGLASEANNTITEPCVPVVKIQKVTKETPSTIQIKRVETLAKSNPVPLNVAPQVKIQKIEVIDTPIEQTHAEVVTLASDEEDVEMLDNTENLETIEINDDEKQESDDADDFHWPETPEVPKPQAIFTSTESQKLKNYYCCQCSSNFVTRPELREHIDFEHGWDIEKAKQKMKKQSSDFPFHCEYCKLRFPTYRTLTNHQEYYQQAAKLCTICGEVVPNTRTAFALHLRTHEITSEADKNEENKNETIICCMCSSTFEQRTDLIAHAEAEHTKEINKCMTKSMFSKDLFECDVCISKFATQAILRRHQARFKEMEMCSECGVLVPLFRRNSHAKTHRSSTVNKRLCDICKKTFPSVASISYHMELHSTDIRLNCTYPNCKAVLRTKLKLQLHLQDHKFRDLGKTVPCPEPGCTMMFYAHKPCQLTRHKRIHTGLTYYDCTQCSKSFVDSTDFKRHQWQHSGVSPYMCKFCNKMHMRKNQLLAHEAICLQTPLLDTSYSLAKNRRRRSNRD